MSLIAVAMIITIIACPTVLAEVMGDNSVGNYRVL